MFGNLMLSLMILAFAGRAMAADPDRDLELKRLELEAIDKAVRYEKDHPGQPNPYREYIAQIHEGTAASGPEPGAWFARNWGWVAGGTAVAIGAIVAVLLIIDENEKPQPLEVSALQP